MIAIQSLSSRQGVSCHVLYGGQHKHNRCRDEDSLLSCKDNRYYYVDKAAIAAKVEDGILTIELPKIQREEGKTSRQIAIS